MTLSNRIFPAEAQLAVTGMNCASCAGRVEKVLRNVAGISGAKVNFATGQAHFRVTSPEAMTAAVAALDQAGYPARPAETRLHIQGMSCASCSARVEKALLAMPGVHSANVNLATGTAAISHSPALSAGELADAVSAKGYPASPRQDHAPPHQHDHDEDAARLKGRFLTALALTLPIFVVEMGGHLLPGLHHWLAQAVGTRLLWLAEFVLTSAVLAGPGRVFFQIGIPALLRRTPEMNSLVALGAGAAWLYSTVATFAPDLLPPDSRHVYFEAAAVIICLILLGRWLEARAKGRAGAAIRHLIELAPETAWAERDGELVETAVADLRAGDMVQIRPGARVPVDGVITAGTGPVDEAMLTGEPMPVVKASGDKVTGGTINGTATLSVRVTATGAETVLARIIHLVQEAQATKLPVQAAVDRVTAVFVPVVIALAVLTFGIWLIASGEVAPALVAAVSVLIIACPCAMGLAVPISIMVGTGRGAELGLLFRRGDALQRLAEAQTIGFDKTGTLTQGQPALTRISVSGISRAEALRLAASAEAQSEHPLAEAILAAARAEGLELAPSQGTKAHAGRGLTAEVEGRALLIGNLAALRETGIDPDPELGAQARHWADEAATPVHLAVDGRHVAALAIADTIRPSAAKTMRELEALGVDTVLLSGDVQAAAEAVGGQLGINRVLGGLLPEDKLQRIRDLGEGTVFVGDGINDAPALAAARTGIAIGTGTDVAIESADVVLVSGDPRGVPRAIRLSRAVMRNIRQNLFWAFAYNAALIPVAMGALVPFGGPQLSPMLGAGAMALSSVFVVTNALRLRRFA
ncbi:heavy metal translocating P-type ATPase [Paracoccus ravus]|uniref:heavy metal translocating P-type ATPase n=1 Tax=Paracoccus ravus TaxID=2447760 RepID=UPI00106EA2A0|nr:heavy metal translocating P-type ATPase [Paracoccus ravus]